MGLLLFDEVEVLDACGPFEVFSVANRVAADDPPSEVVLVAAGRTPGEPLVVRAARRWWLVARLASAEVATATARQVDYAWSGPGASAPTA